MFKKLIDPSAIKLSNTIGVYTNALVFLIDNYKIQCYITGQEDFLKYLSYNYTFIIISFTRRHFCIVLINVVSGSRNLQLRSRANSGTVVYSNIYIYFCLHKFLESSCIFCFIQKRLYMIHFTQIKLYFK